MINARISVKITDARMEFPSSNFIKSYLPRSTEIMDIDGTPMEMASMISDGPKWP